jgi:exo-beta-1,3-glucanase (GH17 family)
MQTTDPAGQSSSRFHLYYTLFNLAILAAIGAWLWHLNTPVPLAEPTMPASGKLQCVSYAPYYGKDQTPFKEDTVISPTQIDQDLAVLAERFECVRIYSVDQGLSHVPKAAEKLGMKVLLGAWIGSQSSKNDRELDMAIKIANQYPQTVKGLIVGNEVLLRRELTPAAMRMYIERAQAGTEVPVTYADVWEFWIKNKELESAVDYVTVHILPYWEDHPVSAEQGVQHTHDVMFRLSSIFTKPLFIGETGWPSVGRQRQESTPSLVNEARYLREFLQLAHEKQWNYNLIEAIDQPWKRDLEGAVGGYWGLYGTDLQPKFGFAGSLQERMDDWRVLLWPLSGALLWLVYGWRLGLRRWSLLSVTTLGAVTAGFAMLQIEYLLVASRNVVEWVALGSIAVAGWFTALLIPRIVIGRTTANLFSHQLVLIFLLNAVLVCNYLQLSDGRYRDFPLALYLLPALQLFFFTKFSGLLPRPSSRYESIIAVIGLLSAMVCVVLEIGSQVSFYWLGIVTLFTLTALPVGRYTKA